MPRMSAAPALIRSARSGAASPVSCQKSAFISGISSKSISASPTEALPAGVRGFPYPLTICLPLPAGARQSPYPFSTVRRSISSSTSRSMSSCSSSWSLCQPSGEWAAEAKEAVISW